MADGHAGHDDAVLRREPALRLGGAAGGDEGQKGNERPGEPWRQAAAAAMTQLMPVESKPQIYHGRHRLVRAAPAEGAPIPPIDSRDRRPQ